jgi:hypothetical protein
MAKSAKPSPLVPVHGKSPVCQMSDDRKGEVVAQLTDDVLAKLTSAFFEVVSKEKWGKRDLALISGLNETAIGHILAGRRKNLTVETIALLARSMQKRPELILRDTRPKGNRLALASSAAAALERAPTQAEHLYQPFTAIQGSSAATDSTELKQNPPRNSALRVLETETIGLVQKSEQ